MKWNFDTYGKIELVEAAGKNKGYLTLAKVDDRSDPAFTFGPDELDKLFQTMVNSEMPILDPALVLYGDEVQTEGFPRASIPAAQANDKGYNKAYEPFQLKDYKPTNFELHVKFRGAPSLWVFCDGFKTGGSAKAPRAKLTFQSAKAPAPQQKPNGPRRQQG